MSGIQSPSLLHGHRMPRIAGRKVGRVRELLVSWTSRTTKLKSKLTHTGPKRGTMPSQQVVSLGCIPLGVRRRHRSRRSLGKCGVAMAAFPTSAEYGVLSGTRGIDYSGGAVGADELRAKYKKFGSMPEAEAFLSTTTTRTTTTKSRPYDRPKDTGTTPKEAQQRVNRREASPITQALPSTLPSHLADLAQKGYAFTTRPPHHLIVYTDGSSLSNGKSSARAGLGVWWGDRGEAAERGLSERVPGGLQTNNRGELLVGLGCGVCCLHFHFGRDIPLLPSDGRADCPRAGLGLACLLSFRTPTDFLAFP